MERKNLTRWAVYQSDVKYKLWNAKNIYDIIKLTTFAAFVKPPSYIRKKLKSFFCGVCKLLTSGIFTKSH